MQAFEVSDFVVACQDETCAFELEKRKDCGIRFVGRRRRCDFLRSLRDDICFHRQQRPPKLFNFSDISSNGPLMISGQDRNKAAAMAFWFVLMAFIMWAGGKIASLGVNLLREIKVEIKGALKTVEEKEPAKTEPKK
jgi:hypothetical protein